LKFLTIVLALTALAAPATAQATTVTATTKERDPSAQVFHPYSVVSVVDTDNRADVLSFGETRDTSGATPRQTRTVHDEAGGLSAGAGCSGGGQDVTCDVVAGGANVLDVEAGGGDDVVLAPGFGPDRVEIHGGDGDDHLSLALDGKLYGDGGNDVLQAGIYASTLVGGSGDDTFIGGARTTVSYADRTAPVTARIGASGNGGAGENDTIGDEVNDLEGGAGDDTLAGSAAGNVIAGGPGADHIDGGGGDDDLFGGATNYMSPLGPYPAAADVLTGGDGNDRLTVGPGGTADGQAGRDALELHGAATAIGGPGIDVVDAYAAGSALSTNDGERDYLNCSLPARTVDADAADVPLGCGAVVHRSRPGSAVLLFAGPRIAGGSAPVRVACPDDAPTGCRVAVAGFVNGRRIGRTRDELQPGTSSDVLVPTDQWTLLRIVRDGMVSERFTLAMRDAAGTLRSDGTVACISGPRGNDDDEDQHDPPPPVPCNAPWNPAPLIMPQLGRLHVTHGPGGVVRLRANADAKDARELDCSIDWGDDASSSVDVGLRPIQPVIHVGHRYRRRGTYQIDVTCEQRGVERSRRITVHIRRRV
jgi:hypothetical protein